MDFQIDLYPILEPWVIGLIALAAALALLQGSLVLYRKRVPRRWISLLAVLRVVAILVFALLLLRPVISYTADTLRSDDLLVLVDTSGSMGDPAAPGAERATPGRLRDLLTRMRETGLASALSEAYDVAWYRFDSAVRPVDGPEVTVAELGPSTRLGDALTDAVTHHRQRDQAASNDRSGNTRVLLVSDGRDLGEDDPLQAARQMGLAVDVLPPPDAPPIAETARAAWVSALATPRRVLLGSEARFRVTLTHDNANEVPLALDLLEDGQVVMTHEITFEPGQREAQIQLAHRPTTPGPKQYQLQAFSNDGDRALDRNPPYEVSLNVVGRSAKVLFLEDTWRWSFKFFRRVMEDDPNFSFTAFVARGPSIYMQFAEPDQTVKLGGFPQSRSELAWFDVIVLGDVRPETWPSGLAAALHDLVVEDGKSLVVIGGAGSVRLSRAPLLQRLLPVEIGMEYATPIPGPVDVRPTTEGAGTSIFFAPGAEGQAVDWAALPMMDQIFPVTRKKPAATVLLEAPDHRNEFGPRIVLAEHTVGQGRVLFLATDSLWKWQLMADASDMGVSPYQLFWQQALRFAAPSRSEDAGMNLWMQTDRSKYRVGQTVEVRAEMDPRAVARRGQVEAIVVMPDGQELPLSLTADAREPSRHTGAFELTAPGQHRIAGVLRVEGRAVADVVAAIDVDPPPGELDDQTVNLAALERLASGTGGRVIHLDDPASWPVGEDTQRTVREARSIDLWRQYALLLLLVGVLSLDWLIRLLRGFV